jgi:hypothetical protein
VTQLARNRVLLVLSLCLFGLAVGVTAAVLRPDGAVRARDAGWGAGGAPAGGDIVGYPADPVGGECGLAQLAGEELVHRRTLPGCHAYQPPAVADLEGRTVVVWEHADRDIAVSTLRSDLSVERTLRLPRPRSAAGVLLPRIGVGAAGDRVAIRYRQGQVVSVGSDLSAWPGGALEVASALIGPRGGVLVGGVLSLIALYFLVAGWTLTLPGRLRRRERQGRCLTICLPERGASVLLEGRAVSVEFERAWFFGLDRAELGGALVTLVLTEGRAGDAYRHHHRLRARQVWAGTFADALERARALRAGTLALAFLVSSVLLLGLDAFLVW